MPKDSLRSHSTYTRNTPVAPTTIYVHVHTYNRVFLWAAYLGLVLVLLNVLSSMIDSPLAYAASTPHAITLKGAPSTPNTQDPKIGSTSLTRTFPAPVPGHEAAHAPVDMGRPTRMPMQAGSVTLQVGKATTFLGSDGRLELDFPAGAITAQDLTAAGGTITARVMQVAPASGSLAGGSGTISLGSYLVQLLDAHGALLAHGLRQTFTARYHLQKKELGLGLEHAYVLLNGVVPDAVLKAQGAVFPAATSGKAQPALASTMGKPQKQATHLDLTAKTLTATPQASTSSTAMSFDSDSPIATFGKPDPTSVDLSSGSLSYSEPIAVPAGPGNLTPPVSLSYSSEVVNDQHNISAAAGWVGEGWSLSLGSITWDEQNVTSGCTGCTANWENTWQLSDPFGTSSELIPPNINVSTFDDDTTNFYCGTGNPNAYPCPILWHTATESHAKIYAYIGPVNIGQQMLPPCFRVWLPNGIMEEFGCTLDSLQYYYEAGLGALVSAWNLDLITDPEGNQIHLTYQQDMENWTSPTTGKTYSYPRDEQLASIQYDSPGCHNAQTMCTGSSWAPQMQVVFNASHGINHLTGSVPSGCNTGANLRCDDPVDLTNNNGYTTSLIQSTFVLNNIQVQVRSSGTASWNTLRSYNLSYEQSGPGTITDPASNTQRSTAGMLDLTQIQQVGSGGASALMYSGLDNSSSTSYAYLKVFDLSSKNITISPNTTLSYRVYPQSSTESGAVNGSNSTCVAIDMVFTDGTDLRDSGAVDQNGNRLHPAFQCNHLLLDQWNLVASDIGAKVSGKTLNRIDVGYDQSANTGGYRGYIDDISLTDPGSSTPLFATGLESGDPQPSWSNTADNTVPGGNVVNVGGICCGLTGPELGARQELTHTDSAATPLVNFSYTSLTNTYVDSEEKPNPTTNCGPSWNTGNGSGCLLWSQSYAGNSRFLSTISNGQGLAQSFGWTLAHNNTHGVNGGGANTANPFFCNANQNGYPCNEADDMGWSRAVLTQNNSTTMRLSQNGQVGAQNTQLYVQGANDGNWYGNVQSLTVTMKLNAGNNSILFSNPSAPAPNIDRILIAGNSYEAEAPGNTLGGGARVDACSTCSGGKEVDWIGNADTRGTLQFNNVNVSAAGMYAVTIFYIDADAGRSAFVTINGTLTPITSTTNYTYQLTYPLPAQRCSDCVAGMYWGNQNDGDFLDYYNAKFMGFAQATVNLPTGAVEVHHYYAGEGWGLYDTSQVTCYALNPCHNSPWWDLANAAHGQEYQAQYYDVDGTTLLKQVNTTVNATCPPSGVGATPPSSIYGNWNGHLVSAIEHNNPVAVCEIQQTQQTSQIYDGASTPVSTTTSWTYDNYGRVTQTTTTSASGTPSKVVQNLSYVWNDNVSATQTSASGTYLIDTQAFADTEDGSGNRLACSSTSYDGQNFATGQTSTLTIGLATTTTGYADCGTAANSYTTSGPSSSTTVYDGYGHAVSVNDADANAGISGHKGCTVNSVQYTSCTAYDTTFEVFPTSVTNVLNQSASSSYANTGQLFGYGTWPSSTTDANHQTTSSTYDALGRLIGMTAPGETSGEFTQQWVSLNWCSGTGAQAPCEEIDHITRLDSSTTVTTRSFYDGEGRLIETRAPGPVGQDIVSYATYDTAGRQIFSSNPYFVPAYTGGPGAAAYSIPDSTQPGTSATYTNLRQSSITDPNSHTSTTTTSVICGVSGTNDTGCYAQVMGVDANGHQRVTLTSGAGTTAYTQSYTGTSGSYALYATTSYQYDAAGRLSSTVSPDGSTSTNIYDDLGRAVSQDDPDHGTTTANYDPNGNVIQTVDARGSAGTVYAGYDGLNRPLWRNSTNSPTGAWVSFTYDSTANGNPGVGKMTGESFTGSGGLSGSYAPTYDARGRQVQNVETINGTAYTTQVAYNDADMATSITYPTGEVVTPGYDANGWMLSLNTQLGGTTTTLASNLTYTGTAGAAGRLTSMDLGSGDSYAFSYDTGMRLTSASLTQVNNNTVVYQTQPAYDAANNVVSVQSSINGATDTQQFCYDSLNRMTWSGTSGTPPCSGVSFSAGTLTGAQYQQSDSYNVDGGFTSGPGGSYTYGDSGHPHAVTSTSSGYSAAYDATGNLICRAPTSGATCSGTQTGQQLSYDAQGRLASWQNQPSAPTQTENYLYDGSGNRVAMQSTVGGTTTTTAYIGGIEEVQKTGGNTQTTTYYTVGGLRVAAKVNGTFYYFGYDALGSQVLVLNSNGGIVGSQLYGPYGNKRYSTGTLPTSIGFTGQRADSVTGLDYYGARYYDLVAGVFTAPDSVQGNAQGMDPYAYVGGNPETFVDPTGHRYIIPDGGDTGSSQKQVQQQMQQNANAFVHKSKHHPSYWQADLDPLLYMNIFDPVGWAKLASQDERGVRWETAVEAESLLFSSGINWNANAAMQQLYMRINGLARAIAMSTAGGLDSFGELDDAVAATMSEDGDLAGLPRDDGKTDNPNTSTSRPSDDNPGGGGNTPPEEQPAGGGEGPCSFTPATVVQTDHGEQTIGSLKVGEEVLSYNPQTKKMEYKPIIHVWVHTDNDLVDLTLVTTTRDAHGKTTQQKEVIHTNKEHPFLTTEKGFLPVGQIHVGMHVLRADGHIGVITTWQLVPGIQMMYNLEVAQDHTFTVGDGQWVVHNCANTTQAVQKLQDAGVKMRDDGHFGDQMGQRGSKLSAEDVQGILTEGDAFYDTRNANFGVKGKVGNTTYAIIFDGDGTLMTFLTQNELSGVRGRYQPMLRGNLPYSWDWLSSVSF